MHSTARQTQVMLLSAEGGVGGGGEIFRMACTLWKGGMMECKLCLNPKVIFAKGEM